MSRVAKSDVFAPPTVKLVPVTDRPRDAEFAWLREHAHEYPGQWLVLDGSQLIASGPRLKDLLRQLGPDGREPDFLLHWVDSD